ncbi:ATP-binding protein [Actinomadura scrupuli]|uniref:ATP-binding protein n=1 Tax=Actinomadura scrupuli TaxID=559629 RepID=UPI003D98A947
MDLLATIVMAGHPAVARDLRRLVGRRLTAIGLRLDPETLADLELCVDELVANAVAHTASGRGGQVTAVIEAGDGVVRIAVIDDGGARTKLQVRTDLLGEGGRGLRLVEELSCRWGSDARLDGRGEVWVEFAAPSGEDGCLRALWLAAAGAGEGPDQADHAEADDHRGSETVDREDRGLREAPGQEDHGNGQEEQPGDQRARVESMLTHG